MFDILDVVSVPIFMKPIKMVLPKPPSVNHLYGVSARYGRVHHYITADGKAWFDMCGYYLKKQHQTITTITKEQPVQVNIKLSFFGRFDLDNCFKAALDFLTKNGIIEDDSQVYEIIAKKVRVKERHKEGIEIEVAPLVVF